MSKGFPGTDNAFIESWVQAECSAASDQWLDHIAIFQQILRPAAVVGDGGGGIDAQDVIEGGEDVLGVVGAGDGVFAQFVGGADVLAHFQAAAAEENGAGVGPVAAAPEV